MGWVDEFPSVTRMNALIGLSGLSVSNPRRVEAMSVVLPIGSGRSSSIVILVAVLSNEYQRISLFSLISFQIRVLFTTSPS